MTGKVLTSPAVSASTGAACPKVLVIDDEAGIRDMLQYFLASRGYQIVTAPNGQEGLLKARKETFDAVISDVSMPGLDGLEVLRGLKKMNPRLEVIMVTGYATIETAVGCMKAGAYDYITKPFQVEDLLKLLERAIEKRRLHLRVDELQELNRTKSEFLANMSHELRTPLNAIVGYTSLVLEGVYGSQPPEQKEALDRVLVNSKNLLALINNILDISKLNAGMMPVFLEDFDAAALVREVAQTLQCLAAQKSLRLETEAPQAVPMRSDKTKVKQILINLTANAIKFTEKGGVTLKAEPAGGGEVRLSVRDTGPGIAPEHLGYIFEKFTQVDGSATRVHGGTGLGLSITHKLCELLGGEVSVESRLGEGSVFAARLPAAGQPTDTKLLPVPANIQRRDGRKVLLCIDDDPEVLRLLRDSLAGSEYDFCGAGSAEEGLALARHLKPFVITLDILMPHRDGWSVLQELKNDPELRSIPVFILSIIENRALGFSLGVSDYIVKPFDRQILLEKLRHQERLQGRRILVVDDEPEIVEFFRLSLTQEGFQVDTAATGREALACLRRTPPDAVFLDLGLPDMSGFDVVEEIQRDPALKGVCVIILTAKNLTEAEKTRLESRVETVIQKCAMNLPDILRDLKARLTAMAEEQAGDGPPSPRARTDLRSPEEAAR